MTINYTTLLGLAKPVTGTETGQWGDVVNDEITSLLEDAVANAATFSVTSGNVTLTTTNGSSNQARMSTLIITGSPGTTRNVIAPSQAKVYVVINQSDGAVVIKGSATTGVTIAAGATGTVVWNGSDFVEVNSTSSGRIIKGNLQVTGNLQVDGNTQLGNSTSDTLAVTALVNSNLLFTDATYDIGASGATRPRNYYGSGTATFGGDVGIGTAPVSGVGHTSLTLDNATQGGLINIYKNGVNSGFIRGNSAGGSGTNLVIGASTGNGIQFLVNGTTTVAATLDSSSNWLVGTTTNTAPYKAIITGTSLRYGLQVKGNFTNSLTENSFTNDGTSGVVIGQYGSTYGGGSNFGVGALGSFVAGGDAAPFAVGTTSSQPLWFGTANAFVAQIDTNGRTQFGAQSLPSGCTSYLLLSRSANNITDPTITIYNSSTGTAAGAALILGTSNASNVGGIGAFGGSYTSNGQFRQNGTYVWNNVSGGSITIHQEQTNGNIYTAIGGTTIHTTNQYGFGIGTTASSTQSFKLLATTASPVAFQTSASTSNGLLQLISTNAGSTAETSISYYNTSSTTYGWTVGLNTDGASDKSFGFYDVASISNRVRILSNSNGSIIARGTIGVGWTSPATTGAGISFPATQSNSSDVNTLDDYEEGSWTPALYDGSNNRSPTYSYGPSGTYTKIGNLVYVRWGFKLSSKGTSPGSGEVQVRGLPFTPKATGGYQEENVSIATGALVTDAYASQCRLVVSASGVYLFGRIANNSDTVWLYSELTDASWIIGEICYQVDT